MKRGIEVAGAMCATGLVLGAAGACSSEGRDSRQLGRSIETPAVNRLPDRPGRPACKFSVNLKLKPQPGLNAPAVWVYPGVIDTAGLRVVRPVMRGHRVFSASANPDGVILNALAVDSKTRWFARRDVANGAGNNRPSSFVCDPGEVTPPQSAEAVTLEGGIVRLPEGAAPRFEIGDKIALDALSAYRSAAVGAVTGESSSTPPAPDMAAYTQP